MNINDIPLPPPANKSNPRLKEQYECDSINTKYMEEDRHISVVPRMPPHSTRRHVNYKLPVGVLQKPLSSQNVFESVNNHRRELFLPPAMNLNSNVTNTFSKLVQSKINYVNETTVQLHRDRSRRDRSNERKTNRKRLRSKNSDHHSPRKKNVKHEKRYCETKPPIKKPPLVMRSQVVVKKPLVSTRHEKSPRLDKNSFVIENHRTTLGREHQTVKEKSIAFSLTTSSSGSSSSNSSSHSSVNIDLPLVSPKSPDEDFDTMDPDPVNQTTMATKIANDYLKQLSATLVQMNMAYQSVYSKIPNKTANQNNFIDLSSIPLPLELPGKPDDSPRHYVGPKTPDFNCDPSDLKLPVDQSLDDNQCSQGRPGAPSRPCSNSIDLGNFFPDSNSSFGSKNLKSPQCSMNVSSHSKDSVEHSEMKLRPLVPKISNFSIDYSQLDNSFSHELLLSICHSKFFSDMKCCCTIPNPDDWGEGFRSCGNGQNCILAKLQIECDSMHCPTEYLCCNSQFTDLEHSLRKMHNIEFFFDIHQTVPWKIRAKKPIQKTRLIFELGGVAESCPAYISPTKDQTSIFISQHVRINAKKDVHSFLYYMNHGSTDQENVRAEKWIVQGNVRVGFFATRDLQVGEELFLTYPTNHRLDVYAPEPSSINGEPDVLKCLRFLIHEPVSHKLLLFVMDNLISSNSNPLILEYFCEMGGPAVLCQLCDSFSENKGSSVDLFEKLVDLLVLVPFRFKKHVNVLGMSLLRFVDTLIYRLGLQLPLSNSHVEKLHVLRDLLSVAAMETKNSSSPSYGAKTDQSQSNRAAAVSSNADILHCRLPPYWRSKECVHNNESRVFFYHRVTKAMQWEMPVYPWEANDDNDMEIYDYNDASRMQVSHDEIQQMYVGLNRIYEIKQKKMQTKGGCDFAKRKKDQQDLHKKEIFKKRIMAFIVNLLKPYRMPSCKEGKIESEEDMIYLTNKLSQTILYKELKLLHDKPEYLEVTTQVEVKTKVYVKAYMQSRGIIYKRPVHYSLSGAQQKNGTREPNAFS